MKIILEKTTKPKGVYWIDSIEFKNEILKNGKTPEQMVKDDIVGGTNLSGHAEYRKILSDNGLINTLELSDWRTSLSIKEKKAPNLTF